MLKDAEKWKFKKKIEKEKRNKSLIAIVLQSYQTK